MIGKEPVGGNPDLTRIIWGRFRMVVLDWGLAPALVARLADVMRYSQNGIRIAVLAPCWSNLEVGAHRVAGFLVNKPLRVNQIRRVLALASGPRPWAADHAPQIPAGAA